jgi:hypothetical protein
LFDEEEAKNLRAKGGRRRGSSSGAKSGRRAA